MKKSELLARIEMLERRIAALEARPVVYPPIRVPSVFYPGDSFPNLAPPWVVTCDAVSSTGLPMQHGFTLS